MCPTLRRLMQKDRKLPVTPTLSLSGRRALVTGASSGIGLAGAAALAEHGAEVVLVARSQDALDQAVEKIRCAGGKALAECVDVTNIAATRTRILELGAFDILLNNAGTNIPGPLLDAVENDFDSVMDLNVKAAFFVAQTVARMMSQSGTPGSIIFTSSQMGHVGASERSIYCASKHAVEGLAKAMALELGREKIRVNTIAPTFINTEMTRSTLQDSVKRDWVDSNIRLGRLGELQDVMGAIVFLASDASSMITGTSIRIDGGWTAA